MAAGESTPGPGDRIDAAKSALRATALARRRALSPAELTAAADALRDRALEVLAPAPTVALYVSTGTEPGTLPLISAFQAAGSRVLLPVLQPDLDLDWVPFDGLDALTPGPRGTLEPGGRRLGLDAVKHAELVFVPGLAVDRAGNRLGRGGGSYDRALRRVGPAALIAVVLHAGEIVDEVPTHGHDQRVHAVLTPDGLVPLGTEEEHYEPGELGELQW